MTKEEAEIAATKYLKCSVCDVDLFKERNIFTRSTEFEHPGPPLFISKLVVTDRALRKTPQSLTDTRFDGWCRNTHQVLENAAP